MLENVVLSKVPIAIQLSGSKATILAGTTATLTIPAWGSGNVYSPNGPTTTQGAFTPPARPSSLLAAGTGGKYYERSKPQYDTLPLSSFLSARSLGAHGDGLTDDTTALQTAITTAATAGKILFIDAGNYKISRTLFVPAGSKIVGESYPVLLSSGPTFSNINTPQALLKIGNPGDNGVVELSDLILSTQGAQPGAVLLQWNLASPSTTPSGIWDVHTRIGGFLGSQLQKAQCPANTAAGTTISEKCLAAYISMHITTSASSLYMENVWLWTADHDVDDPALSQISIGAGRGLLVESTVGNIWMLAMAVEHHARYQYQLSNTKDIFMGFIQTETPYYQSNPPANQPFPLNATIGDPNFSESCPSGSAGNCAMAWGLRVVTSKDLHVYGAGLYSFFNGYSTSMFSPPISNSSRISGLMILLDLGCSAAGAKTPCQQAIFQYDSASSDVYVYNLNTVGATGMVYKDLTKLATNIYNLNVYPSTIVFFRSS